MKRGMCHHCRKRKATATWTFRPCALGRNVKIRLCWICDITLNGSVLKFARFPRAAAIIKRYRAKVRRVTQ